MMRKEQFMIQLKNWICITGIALLVGSCNSSPTDRSDEALDKGTIHISVDESFKPVMDSQIQVFESSYPETKIFAQKPKMIKAQKTKQSLISSFFFFLMVY